MQGLRERRVEEVDAEENCCQQDGTRTQGAALASPQV